MQKYRILALSPAASLNGSIRKKARLRIVLSKCHGCENGLQVPYLRLSVLLSDASP